jgi:hypothetical protein
LAAAQTVRADVLGGVEADGGGDEVDPVNVPQLR